MSGEMDQAEGRVKQAAGDLTGDKDLEREGKLDELGGKAKDAFDDAKDKVEDVLEDVKDKADDAVDAIKDKFKKD